MAGRPNDRRDVGAADDGLNDEFQSLLRDAADKREERAQTLKQADVLANREESAALLDLARGRRKRRAAGR
jgi:hypothetical protein